MLLIDDHEMVAEGLTAALEPRGISIVGRPRCLAEGISAAVGLRPDVVLLDFRLPDGDALDGLRALAERTPGVPVVVLTAVASPETAVEVLKAGAMGYVTKDLPIDVLVDAVEAASKSELFIAPAILTAVVGQLSSPPPDAESMLSAREQEVLALMGDGHGVDDIAASLLIGRSTARSHVQAILKKLGAHTQLEAVAIAHRGNLI